MLVKIFLNKSIKSFVRYGFFALTFLFSLALTGASDHHIISLTQNGYVWPNTTKLIDLQYKDLAGGPRLLTLNVRKVDNPDLNLSFETEQEWKPYYRLVKGSPHLSTQQARSGNYAAGFYGNNPIVLEPLKGSIFRQESQSFTIDFWVFPKRLADGECIFQYSSSIYKNQKAVVQNIVASIEKGRIVWCFQNVFFNVYGESVDLRLAGQPILKNCWHRHTLRYQDDIGMLEILDDDMVSDVTYATPTGHETQMLYTLDWQIAKHPHITLGEFSGYLDDFRILPYYQNEFTNQGRFTDRGTLVTDAYDLKGKKFCSFNLVGENKNSSLFTTYLRFASYKADLQSGKIPWQRYVPGQKYTGPTDRYVQFRVDFFSGIGAETSPVLRDMLIVQEPIPAPPTPGRIVFERQKNGVLLKWAPMYTGNIAGYKVYFGQQSGNYFGKSRRYASPIDVGNVTELYLDGLEIGKMYYFSLTAYSDNPLRGESAFAPETTYLP